MSKVIMVATACFLMSFQVLGYEFECEAYSQESQRPILEAKQYNIEIDEYSKEARLTSPDMDGYESGEYFKFYSPYFYSQNKAYFISFGDGKDEVKFIIRNYPGADVIKEYVRSVGLTSDLNDEELEKLDEKLRSRFSGLNVNGTIRVFTELDKFMTCRRL